MIKIDKWHSFDCFIMKQGDSAPEVATFAIDAYNLLELSTVSRIEDEEKGYQRRVNKTRVAAIRRFVEIPEAILPTSIVLATGEKKGYVRITNRQSIGESGRIWSATINIKCSESYKPLLVIDGQHRLYGVTSSSRSPYPLSVTLLLNAPELVQMAHFEVINNKATRIPTAHLNELRAMMFQLSADEETKLESLLGQLGVQSLSSSALVSELNGPGMIFESILDFPSNDGGFVSSNAIKRTVERARRSGFLQYISADDNEDLRALNASWMGVAKKFSKRWKLETGLFQKYADDNVKKNVVKKSQRLLHSGSIEVIGGIIDDELSSATHRKKWLNDSSKISGIVNNEILKNIPESFWDDDDLKIDNTAKGKKSLKSHLDELMA